MKSSNKNIIPSNINIINSMIIFKIAILCRRPFLLPSNMAYAHQISKVNCSHLTLALLAASVCYSKLLNMCF